VATSNTYNFAATTDLDAIITEAYERCGLVGDILTAQQIQTAFRSLNLMLASWPNEGINLWTVEQGVINLVMNQSTYNLPLNIIDFLECTIRSTIRKLSGAPASSSGIAAQAFDANDQTACTETAPDGWISYDYGANTTQAISMVGITSETDQNYTLLVQTSIDNTNWTTRASPPLQFYPALQTIWIAIDSPIQQQYVRIIETGGATLNINELYFNVADLDYIITRLSRAEYVALPNKTFSSRTSSFYVDRLTNPVVNLWPTPNNEFPMLYYTGIRMIQDATLMTQNPDMPSRFLDAVCSGLAWRVALKSFPDRVDRLKAEYLESFTQAFRQDTENVPLRIYPDFYGWT